MHTTGRHTVVIKQYVSEHINQQVEQVLMFKVAQATFAVACF